MYSYILYSITCRPIVFSRRELLTTKGQDLMHFLKTKKRKIGQWPKFGPWHKVSQPATLLHTFIYCNILS